MELRADEVFVVRNSQGGPVPKSMSYLNHIAFGSFRDAQAAIVSRQNISEEERQRCEDLVVFRGELVLREVMRTVSSIG